MRSSSKDSLATKANLNVCGKSYVYFDMHKAAAKLGFNLAMLPRSLKVVLENLLRFEDQDTVKITDIGYIKEWLKARTLPNEIAFRPARVLMQDFTGVPAIVDLAAMRDSSILLGIDPNKINPMIPVDLVIDHSVQVDKYASGDALQANVKLEMQRNLERYQFLRWGQKSFKNFRVVPPGTGICHQVNLECLAKVVWSDEFNGETYVYPDTLVGTDSHTTMVNALAVLGWGVGGIEAEAAMLGQPLSMLLPDVVGMKLTGALQEGVTATDLVLTITQILRKKGVVGKFVEFYGDGLSHLSLSDRATISNMAPEYGATCGFFPVDVETIKYLKLTARGDQHIKLVEAYAKAQGLWRENDDLMVFSDVIELDISKISPSLAGPKRPQDKVNLDKMAINFAGEVPSLNKNPDNIGRKYKVAGKDYELENGSVVIAAITSCTNTSNPYVMMGAGLLARKARALGLKSKPWVKTSLAPGSQVVSEYYDKSGLTEDLNALGFNLVGYGCTTCIGNSGPLNLEIDRVIKDNNLVVASVLSGNRNFEGRVHPGVRANYLASPPLCVAYAIAGTVNIDLSAEAIAKDKNGNDVYLKDIWPSTAEINELMEKFITPEMFSSKYAKVFEGDEEWNKMQVTQGLTYGWDEASTYIKNPPYFHGMEMEVEAIKDIKAAKVLAIFGDSITTDHISPAGNIAKNGPAALYLQNNNVTVTDFNSFGARRGNHEVMMRGTFANIRIKNEMLAGVEGGYTNIDGSEQLSIYDAAMKYKEQGVPLVVIAGKEYGTGSSRDWAAKGTNLLGVRAVIAESFERIHRSNLVGMGILPLAFVNGENRSSLNLTGDVEISIPNLADLQPGKEVVCYVKKGGAVKEITLICQVNTGIELLYLKHGGILNYVLRHLAN